MDYVKTRNQQINIAWTTLRLEINRLIRNNMDYVKTRNQQINNK